MTEQTGDIRGRPGTGEGRERKDVSPTGKPAPDRRSPDREPPETAEHPAPGIEHEPEPDAENIVPAKDRPGTL